ncbi:hypothetical protein TL16_g11197 [Triparma laevis f. inornata]|uniref:Uncharacterized protein n=1 Tax=Triparma laevis f. inornata TaxID=1714386 RepID=A0A9W7ES03_9STRA|nr:hypothetical protein TL16_g11197 [Triparma laevis f. inornata]
MSKSLASESNEGYESREISGKRGAEDEQNEEGEGFVEVPPAESLSISTTASTVPATTDQFMYTPEFRRHFVEFVPLDTLLTMKVISKEFEETTREYIAWRVKNGEMILHRGVNIAFDLDKSSVEEKEAFAEAAAARHNLVTQVVFLQNLPRIGDFACFFAWSLVIVDIPEGVVGIGDYAFGYCNSLTAISFPRTLTLIGGHAFEYCKSLENVDLLHTNLQEIDDWAFQECSELKLMTIPDSLQAIGIFVFDKCSKLAPSNIDVNDDDDDLSPKVVAHLRSQMSLNALFSGNNFLNTDDFRRLIVPFLQNEALMTIRPTSKPWSRVVDAFIDDGVESGAMIVHDGEDTDWQRANARVGRIQLVTRVIFLLNITKVGDSAFWEAVSLVVVNFPEGTERIGRSAFHGCLSLTTVSFPTTLTTIGDHALRECTSLDNVELLHTNLQELGHCAFANCSELKSMTIPDTLQTFGTLTLSGVCFHGCFKLVPSSINISLDNDNDPTSEVVAYLRSQQLP